MQFYPAQNLNPAPSLFERTFGSLPSSFWGDDVAMPQSNGLYLYPRNLFSQSPYLGGSPFTPSYPPLSSMARPLSPSGQMILPPANNLQSYYNRLARQIPYTPAYQPMPYTQPSGIPPIQYGSQLPHPITPQTPVGYNPIQPYYPDQPSQPVQPQSLPPASPVAPTEPTQPPADPGQLEQLRSENQKLLANRQSAIKKMEKSKKKITKKMKKGKKAKKAKKKLEKDIKKFRSDLDGQLKQAQAQKTGNEIADLQNENALLASQKKSVQKVNKNLKKAYKKIQKQEKKAKKAGIAGMVVGAVVAAGVVALTGGAGLALAPWIVGAMAGAAGGAASAVTTGAIMGKIDTKQVLTSAAIGGIGGAAAGAIVPAASGFADKSLGLATGSMGNNVATGVASGAVGGGVAAGASGYIYDGKISAGGVAKGAAYGGVFGGLGAAGKSVINGNTNWSTNPNATAATPNPNTPSVRTASGTDLKSTNIDTNARAPWAERSWNGFTNGLYDGGVNAFIGAGAGELGVQGGTVGGALKASTNVENLAYGVAGGGLSGAASGFTTAMLTNDIVAVKQPDGSAKLYRINTWSGKGELIGTSNDKGGFSPVKDPGTPLELSELAKQGGKMVDNTTWLGTGRDVSDYRYAAPKAQVDPALVAAKNQEIQRLNAEEARLKNEKSRLENEANLDARARENYRQAREFLDSRIQSLQARRVELETAAEQPLQNIKFMMGRHLNTLETSANMYDARFAQNPGESRQEYITRVKQAYYEQWQAFERGEGPFPTSFNSSSENPLFVSPPTETPVVRIVNNQLEYGSISRQQNQITQAGTPIYKRNSDGGQEISGYRFPPAIFSTEFIPNPEGPTSLSPRYGGTNIQLTALTGLRSTFSNDLPPSPNYASQISGIDSQLAANTQAINAANAMPTTGSVTAPLFSYNNKVIDLDSGSMVFQGSTPWYLAGSGSDLKAVADSNKKVVGVSDGKTITSTDSTLNNQPVGGVKLGPEITAEQVMQSPELASQLAQPIFSVDKPWFTDNYTATDLRTGNNYQIAADTWKALNWQPNTPLLVDPKHSDWAAFQVGDTTQGKVIKDYTFIDKYDLASGFQTSPSVPWTNVPTDINQGTGSMALGYLANQGFVTPTPVASSNYIGMPWQNQYVMQPTWGALNATQPNPFLYNVDAGIQPVEWAEAA